MEAEFHALVSSAQLYLCLVNRGLTGCGLYLLFKKEKKKTFLNRSFVFSSNCPDRLYSHGKEFLDVSSWLVLTNGHRDSLWLFRSVSEHALLILSQSRELSYTLYSQWPSKTSQSWDWSCSHGQVGWWSAQTGRGSEHS